MFKYFAVFLFCIMNCCSSFAEPDPFGIEINRSTYEDVRQKYSGRDAGINKYSQGRMYDINCSQIDIDGLKSIRVIFHKNDKLLAVITKFDKDKYQSLMDSLSKKYKLISKQDAFVGNKYAKFKTDNTIIDLDSPHMSFELSLSYVHNDFEKLYLDTIQQEKEEAQRNQTNAL